MDARLKADYNLGEVKYRAGSKAADNVGEITEGLKVAGAFGVAEV